MTVPNWATARAKRRREEDQIQRAIIAYVAQVVPQPHLLFHVPNGGLRTKAEGAILKGLGVVAGVFDLVLIMPGGRAYFLEVKAADGELEESQERMTTLFIRLGQPYAVVRSIDNVRAALARWNIPTREAAT